MFGCASWSGWGQAPQISELAGQSSKRLQRASRPILKSAVPDPGLHARRHLFARRAARLVAVAGLVAMLCCGCGSPARDAAGGGQRSGKAGSGASQADAVATAAGENRVTIHVKDMGERLKLF
jgi:hypothetical protein